MKILSGQIQGTPAPSASPPANQEKIERAAIATSTVTTVGKAPANAGALAAKSIDRSTDVTLRRDSNGRVYYVVSDANSGQEIIELPPKALRNIGQGISDYLKEAQSKATSHIKVKA